MDHNNHDPSHKQVELTGPGNTLLSEPDGEPPGATLNAPGGNPSPERIAKLLASPVRKARRAKNGQTACELCCKAIEPGERYRGTRLKAHVECLGAAV